MGSSFGALRPQPRYLRHLPQHRWLILYCIGCCFELCNTTGIHPSVNHSRRIPCSSLDRCCRRSMGLGSLCRKRRMNGSTSRQVISLFIQYIYLFVLERETSLRTICFEAKLFSSWDQFIKFLLHLTFVSSSSSDHQERWSAQKKNAMILASKASPLSGGQLLVPRCCGKISVWCRPSPADCALHDHSAHKGSGGFPPLAAFFHCSSTTTPPSSTHSSPPATLCFALVFGGAARPDGRTAHLLLLPGLPSNAPATDGHRLPANFFCQGGIIFQSFSVKI